MNRHGRAGSWWTSWSLSILLHAGVIAVAVGWWFWSRRSEPPPKLALEGTVVTSEELARRSAPAPVEPAPEPEPPVVEPEPAPEEPSAEELAAASQAEAQRVAEERRVAEEQLAAERKANDEAERQKAERAREQREREQREKAEKERLAKEKVENERRERELADRARREAELSAQLASEQQSVALRGSAQARQYADLIKARIESAWRVPGSARADLSCVVTVTQVPGGAVTGARVGRCNGDEVIRQSLVDAAYRASPLPAPPDPALFERELELTFSKPK